ncbi:MAG: response regulator [Desulfobacteraceae bacterium]|nr:response regulator [Desulfobacteraceae bacterium]
MDKVLIVDRDSELLADIRKGLDKVQQFEVLTAGDGDEALSVMSSHYISVLATDIETPTLDALELLAYMSQKHPNTPCIVMTDRGKPWFKKRISQQSFLYHLEKPFEIKSLVSALFVGLNLRDEGQSAKGMTMASLLPLIELQQKTCRMQVRAEGKRKGYLYFENGEIIDAHCGKLAVDDAAREMASWDRISFVLSDLPRRRSRRRIKTKLMDFAEATWSRGFNPAPAGDSEDSGNAGNSGDTGEIGADREEVITLEDEVIELLDEVEEESAGEEADETDAGAKARSAGPEITPETRQKVAEWLETIVSELRDIRDCRTIALIDTGGDVLVNRQGGGEDVDKLAYAMSAIMANARKTAAGLGLDHARSFTLHARDVIVIIQQLEDRTSVPLFALVTCGARSNWSFIKSRLDELSF